MITREQLARTDPKELADEVRRLEKEMRESAESGMSLEEAYELYPETCMVEAAMNEHAEDVGDSMELIANRMTQHGHSVRGVSCSLYGRGILIGWRAAVALVERRQLQAMFDGKEEEEVEKLTADQVLELADYIRDKHVFMAGEDDDLAAHTCRFVGKPMPFPESMGMAKKLIPRNWLYVADWPEEWRSIWWHMGAAGREAECVSDFLQEMAVEL